MNAPKIPSFIKQNTYKRYQGTYRFYDPNKEMLDAIKSKYVGETMQNQEKLRGSLRQSWEKSRKNSKCTSSVRTLVIFIFLLLAGSLWMLRSNIFETFFEAFLRR